MDYPITNADMSAYVESMLSGKRSVKDTLISITEWLAAGLDGKSRKPGDAALVRYMLDADRSSFVSKDAPEFPHFASQVRAIVEHLGRVFEVNDELDAKMLALARQTLKMVEDKEQKSFAVANIYSTVMTHFDDLGDISATYRLLNDIAKMCDYSAFNKEELAEIVAKMCERWDSPGDSSQLRPQDGTAAGA